MKIEIEIPGWAEGQFISITAGKELIAYKKPGEALHVKVERCNMCGKCCMDLSQKFFLPTKDGTCQYLVKDGDIYKCSILGKRPGVCDQVDPVMWRGDTSYCSVRYKPS
jgi:Fe-S-cluster containining protein